MKITTIQESDLPARWNSDGAKYAQAENRRSYVRKKGETVNVVTIPGGLRIMAMDGPQVLFHEDAKSPEAADKAAILAMKNYDKHARDYDEIKKRDAETGSRVFESALSFTEKRALQKSVADGMTKLKGGGITFAEKRALQKTVAEGMTKLKGTAPPAPDPVEKNTRDTFLKRDLPILKHFIGKSQIEAVGSGIRSEEGQFFLDKMAELAKLVSTMPKVYGQDGKGDQAVVYLHYFKGGSDWYITERDTSEEQEQAFGYAILNGDDQNAELGYISISEIIASNVELDFYWSQKTLAQIKGKGPTEVDPQDENTVSERLVAAIVAVGGTIKDALHSTVSFTVAGDDKPALLGYSPSLNKYIVRYGENGMSNTANHDTPEAALAEYLSAGKGEPAIVVPEIVTELLAGKYNGLDPLPFLAKLEEAADALGGDVSTIIPAAIAYLEANSDKASILESAMGLKPASNE